MAILNTEWVTFKQANKKKIYLYHPDKTSCAAGRISAGNSGTFFTSVMMHDHDNRKFVTLGRS